MSLKCKHSPSKGVWRLLSARQQSWCCRHKPGTHAKAWLFTGSSSHGTVCIRFYCHLNTAESHFGWQNLKWRVFGIRAHIRVAMPVRNWWLCGRTQAMRDANPMAGESRLQKNPEHDAWRKPPSAFPDSFCPRFVPWVPAPTFLSGRLVTG